MALAACFALCQPPTGGVARIIALSKLDRHIKNLIIGFQPLGGAATSTAAPCGPPPATGRATGRVNQCNLRSGSQTRESVTGIRL